MSKPKVFVTRVIPDRGLQKILTATEATVWQDELPPPREKLLATAHDCDGLVTLLTDKVDDELFDAAPKLSFAPARDRSLLEWRSPHTIPRPRPRGASIDGDDRIR